jgi:pimeloyl-ACP methyl ester carboxylesterase
MVPTLEMRDMQNNATRHRQARIGNRDLFIREAGPEDAPPLILPHGYPCSSFQFRRLMPALGDRWHTIAFDWPGFGYSETPDPTEFGYDFDAYAEVLGSVTDALGMDRYALWLHDYGSQIGLRHAIAHPDRIMALIIQNGDIYEDVLGPKYETIKAWWADKTDEKHRSLEEAVSEDGFRKEFVGEVSEDIASRTPPDLWKLLGR